MKLESKKVAIVGASSGMGAALAHALARKGCRIALVARRKDRLDEIVREINARAGRTLAIGYVADVVQTDTAAPLLEQIALEMGGLDVLIYSAGVLNKVAIDEYNIEKDRATIDVNVIGAMAWINAAAKRFEVAKSGVIAGISSIAADRGRAGTPAYHASKAALDTFLESMRNRLAKHGVQVTTLKPGWVDTDMVAALSTPIKPCAVDQAAKLIIDAIESETATAYIPGFWRYIGIAIKLMPSFIMQRAKF